MFQAVPGAAAGPPGGGGVMDPVGPQVNCQNYFQMKPLVHCIQEMH